MTAAGERQGQRLEARGAALAGVLAAAAAGLVEVLAEAIASDAWRGAGIRSVEHWAALRFGLSAGRARRLAAAAAALAELPACRQAFAAGEITEDHVAAIARSPMAPVHDDQVAHLARSATVGQLERALALLPPPPAPPQAEVVARPAASPGERLVTGHGDDGSWFLHGRVDADRGAVIERALLAARDQLFRARHADRPPEPAELAEVSGVDALEHLARTALDAMDPATAGGGPPSERYVVDVHLSADARHGHLHLGPALPAAVRSLVTCDSAVRAWITSGDGAVDLGRRQHTVGARLRKVVEHRDGGCRIPGCEARRWLNIHHIRHWADGGPTDTGNLVALCPAHHRLVHHGELVLRGNPDDGTLTTTTGCGAPFGPSPPTPPARPGAEAASEAGLPPPQWTNRSGERAQWRWFAWDPPSPLASDGAGGVPAGPPPAPAATS